MKLECITTSVGFGDLLAATLPENLPLLDNLVVMTSPDDEETIAVCRRHSVHCVTSHDGKRDGPFNKGRLINRALDQIGGRDWILHLDSDIVLPRKFRQMLEWADLDEHCIYGVDRQNVRGFEEWQNFKKHVGAWDPHAWSCQAWFHPKFPPMSRWISDIHGYVPVGFFCLWHGSASVKQGYHHRRMTNVHGDAARSDVQFSLQWDRRHRVLLPEVIVLHLESEVIKQGGNWNGRTSKRFGPPLSKPEARIADY